MQLKVITEFSVFRPRSYSQVIRSEYVKESCNIFEINKDDSSRTNNEKLGNYATDTT